MSSLSDTSGLVGAHAAATGSLRVINVDEHPSPRPPISVLVPIQSIPSCPAPVFLLRTFQTTYTAGHFNEPSSAGASADALGARMHYQIGAATSLPRRSYGSKWQENSPCEIRKKVTFF